MESCIDTSSDRCQRCSRILHRRPQKIIDTSLTNNHRKSYKGMKFDLQNEIDRQRFKDYSEKLLRLGKQTELSEVRITRTQQQNKALHVYFTLISHELNELGLEFSYIGLNNNDFALRYSPEIVKEFIFKPIILTMFGLKSTTKLTSIQINETIDVITKFFANKGISLDFPSVENLM